MLTVTVFSLVIYYWAMQSSLSRPEMEAAIASQSGGEDDWEAQVAESWGEEETPAT